MRNRHLITTIPAIILFSYAAYAAIGDNIIEAGRNFEPMSCGSTLFHSGPPVDPLCTPDALQPAITFAWVMIAISAAFTVISIIVFAADRHVAKKTRTMKAPNYDRRSHRSSTGYNPFPTQGWGEPQQYSHPYAAGYEQLPVDPQRTPTTNRPMPEQ